LTSGTQIVNKKAVMTLIQNILVPVDFTEPALYAARLAASLALAHNARLYVLHVKAPFPVHGRIVAGSLENVQKHRMKKERAELPKVIPAEMKNSITVEEIQVTGIPVYRVIVEKARQLKVDVIVMASRERRGWARFFKKDLTAEVIRNAHCSVFVARPPAVRADV
jgi:nucleotide-binding universal stress UspA family protein